MRILHCIPSMAGGGAERQLTYLAAGLRKRGDKVHVATTSRGVNWDRLLESGATAHELRTAGPHDPRLFWQLRALIRKVDPHVVQVWLRQMDVVGGLAALVQRKPLVLAERTSIEAYPPSLKHHVRVRIGSRADAIVANSEQGAAYWRACLADDRRLHVIPNIVPVADIAEVSPAADLPFTTARPLVLFAGRLDAEKNVETLLTALSAALVRTSFNVAFCGTGTMQARVVEWIASNGLGEHAAILGYTPALWSVMKRAAVLVSPALFEGSPNVVLEAMAARCPLIVSEIPGHRALLDESSALFVDPQAPLGFASAICDVLQAPAAAEARADAAFARTGLYDTEAIASSYQEVYRTIVDNG